MNYIVPKNSPAIQVGNGVTNIVLSENHGFSNDVVATPLENGTPLVDHIVVLPDELEVVIHTGNTPDANNRFPSQVIYAQLKEMRNKRELCDIFTLHEHYTNMAIKSVSVPNVAPFPGKTDITVNFIRVDIISEIKPNYPRDQYEKSILSVNGDIAAREANKALQLVELQKKFKQFALGYLLHEDDVADSATSIQDLGEGEIYSDFPDPTTMDANGQYQLDLSVYDQSEINVLSSGYAAFEGLMKYLSDAYSAAGNVTQDIRNKLQMVSTNISLISNLSIGAQRFTRTITGQVFGISSYFNVMTNNWGVSLTDAQGADLIAGASLVLGVNVLQGINKTYATLNSDGTITQQPLAIKGMTVSPPLTAGVNAKGIESSPYAFYPLQGLANCCIMVFTDDETLQAYNDLIRGLVKRELNFSIDDMDYTVVAEG